MHEGAASRWARETFDTTPLGDVTDETLKLGPPRLLAFLEGVSDPAIRALFAPLGWSDERLDQAWALLSELKAANKIPATPAPDPTTEAIAACEACQATGLIRARATMQLSFPEQAAFVFHDFVPGKGAAAVLNVQTFLERCKELESPRGAQVDPQGRSRGARAGRRDRHRQGGAEAPPAVRRHRPDRVAAAPAAPLRRRREAQRGPPQDPRVDLGVDRHGAHRRHPTRSHDQARDRQAPFAQGEGRRRHPAGACAHGRAARLTPVVVAPVPIAPARPQVSAISAEVAPESRAA